MSHPNRNPLTRNQFNDIPLKPDWNISDIPISQWNQLPALARPATRFAVMASGSLSTPIVHKGIEIVAGIDVLSYEPFRRKDEPEGNAYHYDIHKVNHSSFPYLMLGPYDKGAIITHWFPPSELACYWKS
jgi:hypothetical protein